MAPYVVAIDHPSLQLLVDPFVDGLRSESRRFDRRGRANPKPFPSLVRKVTDRQRRRFGVIEPERLVAMASLSRDGEVAVAVLANRRGRGLGSMLLSNVVERAGALGYRRLVMESSRRSRPVAALGARFGWKSFEIGLGRVELVLDLRHSRTGTS